MVRQLEGNCRQGEMVLDWGGDSRNEEKQRDPWNIQGVRKVGLAGGLVRGGGGARGDTSH